MVVTLSVICLLLIFLIVFQLSRASELLNVLKGKGINGEDSTNTNAILLMLFMIFGLIGVVWSTWYYYDLFLPESASEHGVWVDEMFNLTLFFTGIVFVITQILTFYFAYKYRQRKNNKVYFFPHNNKLELLWTAVPAVVLAVLVTLGIESWTKITSPAPDNSRIIEVTGQQFNWIVRYPGDDNVLGDRSFERISAENQLGIDFEDEFSRDDVYTSEIHLVVNQPVLFKLGAKDVLHSFFLPHFRVKQDCVPGIPTQFWFTPTITTKEMRQKLDNENFNYELACAELCGQAHWNMRMEVIVETEEEYNKWFAEQKPIYDSVKPSMAEQEESSEEEIKSEGLTSL
ncbi:MAG: cytochrome c oxidase subunit II [Chitinophagales bacterium]